jgi:MFS family permease
LKLIARRNHLKGKLLQKTNVGEKKVSKSFNSTRESLPVYATSIGWSAGRSSIFTFLSYFGVVIGASPAEMSILVSVRNLGSNVFQGVWGWLADLKGRKLVLMIGLSTLVLSTFLVPFVRNPFELVLISLLMTSVGFAVIPSWLAFLGDYSFEKTRASFIGFVNSIGTYTSVFFIFALGFLMDSTGFPFPNSKEVFFIPFLGATLIFSITIFVALFLVEKYDIRKKVVMEDELKPSWKTLINRNPPFKRLLPIDAFFKFCMASAWPIFPYVALNVADSWTLVAIMWIVFNLPRGFGQSIGGKLADKYGKKSVLWLSRLGYVVVPIGYAIGLIAGEPLYLVIVAIPGGLAFGAEETSISTYSLDCSTEETKARYYSILLTAEGVTATLGSLFSGFLMQFLLVLLGDGAFFVILFYLLMLIGLLRFISAMLHAFIHSNPLDFEFNLQR